MKITLICHYFFPEIGAPSARIYEMAKCWVKQGHEVQIVTCFPNHPTGVIPEKYQGMKYLREEIDGIIVHRNYVYATPNKGFIKKTIGHISFMFSSVIFSLSKIGKPDVIITSSPTFFSIISGFVFRFRKKTPFILEIRDLWPAAIVELGVLTNKFIINILEKMELYFYKKSTRLVMVTNAFKTNLINRGIEGRKIDVLTNGYDDELYYPKEKDEALLTEYDLKDSFVLEYVGAHGISQALDKIISVAESLMEYEDIRFIFVGEGAEKDNLMESVKERNISNVKFIDAQPKDMIPRFYSIADICLIPLKKVELFKTFIPSKMFEIMGCGVPIVASLEGEAAEILEKSEAAIITPPEDVLSIKNAILRLREDKRLREQMSKSGTMFVKKFYTREAIASEYLNVMEKALEEFKK